MRERDLSITKAVKPFDDELATKISELAVKSGWGVFENRDGISCMPHTELRNVWEEEAQAEGEAAQLNDSEGELDYEITGDPESNIYRQVWFNTGRVALTGVKPEVVLQATYERVSE